MRFAYPDEPPTLDPLARGGASNETRDILRPVLPALFRLDRRLDPVPDLVRAWPEKTDFTMDPFTVKLTLKKAVWSDGKQITSRDIAFSAGKLRVGPTGYRYRYLKGVDVLTPRSFRLRFDRPLRRWWSLFSLDDMVLPAHAYSPAWANGPSVSGGPFAFKSWTKGFEVKLVRNDAFWGEHAKLATLDIRFVPDEQTRLQLLRSKTVEAFFSEGDANMGRRARAYGFPPTYRALDGEGGASGAWGPTWLELDLDSSLGTAVRRALVEGTEPSLADELLEDSGRAMNAIPADFDHVPTTDPWRGRGEMEKVHSLVGDSRPTVRLAFAHGAAAGVANYMHFHFEPDITVELAGLEADSLEKDWIPARRAPAFLRVRRGADAPDAESYASSSKQPGSGPVDADVTAAETTGASTALRTGVAPTPWTEVETKLEQAGTAAPLVRLRTWIVGRPGVSGPDPAGTSEGPFAGAATWDVENRN